MGEPARRCGGGSGEKRGKGKRGRRKKEGNSGWVVIQRLFIYYFVFLSTASPSRTRMETLPIFPLLSLSLDDTSEPFGRSQRAIRNAGTPLSRQSLTLPGACARRFPSAVSRFTEAEIPLCVSESLRLDQACETDQSFPPRSSAHSMFGCRVNSFDECHNEAVVSRSVGVVFARFYWE